jgi:hypothetical protein
METQMTAGGAHEARTAGFRGGCTVRRVLLALGALGLSVLIGTGVPTAHEAVVAENEVLRVHADDWPW